MGRKAVSKPRDRDPARRAALASRLLPALDGRGMATLTMDDLAALLGKSKATVYKYFASQEELVGLALDLKLQAIQAFMPLLTDRSQPLLARYHAAISLVTQELAEVSIAFLDDLRAMFPRLWLRIDLLQAMAAQALEAFYQEGIEAGILAPLHLAVMVESDRFLFARLTDPSFLKESKLSISEAFESYFRMKFYGLLREDVREKQELPAH